MRRPTTIEEAMLIASETKTPAFADMNENDQKYHLADWQWGIITKALNKLRDPLYNADWINRGQRKYWPWVEIKKDPTTPSGFGFSRTGYSYSRTYACVGSRHSFASGDDVLYALETFGQIYIETRIR